MKEKYYVIKRKGWKSKIVARNLNLTEARKMVKYLIEKERKENIKKNIDSGISAYFIFAEKRKKRRGGT